MLVVHPHLHPRRTGVTRHVDDVVATLNVHLETRALGDALQPGTPRIGWKELWSRAGNEDVIWHAHRNNELLWGLLLRALGRRLKLVFTRHSGTPPKRFTRFIAKRADQLVTLTPEMAATVALPSTVVNHGVDLRRFHPPEDRAAAWARLGQQGKYGIGVVGRIRPAKGQGDFVDALAPLLPSHSDWQPILVGRSMAGEKAWAEGLRAKLPRLELIPEQSDIAPWMQALHILVQPSHSEGFSLVLLEALASGCCVVASKLPYVPSVIEHGRNGFLYPPGDVGALRAVLEQLLADPARVEAVGNAAAEDAANRFGLDAEAQALIRIYRQLIG